MAKWVVSVQYHGSAYYGWQLQSGLETVQGCVENALSYIADERIRVICSGRTDRGVHALNQVVHFSTSRHRTERAYTLGANTILPHDIRIRTARAIDDTFHARFSATARHYSYLIYNASCRHAIFHHQSMWCHQALDVTKMQTAANELLGTHDFSGFRGPHCQAHSPVRTIKRLDVQRDGPWVIIQVSANAFLHHMVRNIVGVLLPIGYGEQPVSYTKQVLDGRNRRLAGITAPASGLYFIGAQYPKIWSLQHPTSTEHLTPFRLLAGD